MKIVGWGRPDAELQPQFDETKRSTKRSRSQIFFRTCTIGITEHWVLVKFFRMFLGIWHLEKMMNKYGKKWEKNFSKFQEQNCFLLTTITLADSWKKSDSQTFRIFLKASKKGTLWVWWKNKEFLDNKLICRRTLRRTEKIVFWYFGHVAYKKEKKQNIKWACEIFQDVTLVLPHYELNRYKIFPDANESPSHDEVYEISANSGEQKDTTAELYIFFVSSHKQLDGKWNRVFDSKLFNAT